MTFWGGGTRETPIRNARRLRSTGVNGGKHARTREGRDRVAVIGSGVSGLTAAYLLQRRYDVTLYEADDRLGGHADTHDVDAGYGALVPVDTGFIVHNERTYPQLCRLFGELGVQTRATEMSMSVHCDGCGLEYAGARGLRGVFARPRSAVRPRYLRMLTEIRRFHRVAQRSLLEPDHGVGSRTLGEFLAGNGFSDYFVQHFAVPLVATVWSSGSGDAQEYPARYLFRFLDNHGMLSVRGSPQWRTVVGGSRQYVERAAKELSSVRTATPVRSVADTGAGVRIRTDGEVDSYDHAVVATHADQALDLLANPSGAVRRALGAFRFTRNEAVLHTDTSLLPRASGAAASWNHHAAACDAAAHGARVTYDLNRLQGLGDTGSGRILVSLGLSDRIDPGRVLEVMSYRHPVYTPESVAAQRDVAGLSTGRIQLAGAWQGWGFHEDGCASGVRAARRLGVDW